jgi:hypothetical protein
MAVFARHVPVRVLELEAGRQVIEPGALDGKSGAGQQGQESHQGV